MANFEEKENGNYCELKVRESRSNRAAGDNRTVGGDQGIISRDHNLYVTKVKNKYQGDENTW